MNLARREWYEEENDCSPIVREFGGPPPTTQRAGKALHMVMIQVSDHYSKPLKEVGKTIQALGRAMNPPPTINHFDARIPTNRAHSMTPAKNSVFSRRGRKRY